MGLKTPEGRGVGLRHVYVRAEPNGAPTVSDIAQFSFVECPYADGVLAFSAPQAMELHLMVSPRSEIQNATSVSASLVLRTFLSYCAAAPESSDLAMEEA